MSGRRWPRTHDAGAHSRRAGAAPGARGHDGDGSGERGRVRDREWERDPGHGPELAGRGDPGRWFLPAGAGVCGSEGAWDGGSRITTYVDGLAAMSAMRDDLERLVAEAREAGRAGVPPGRRGHVYLAAWRLNALRDLYGTDPWTPGDRAGDGDAWPGGGDPTVLGLLLRLLQAGVRVRALLWLPATPARALGYGPHIEDHLYLARVVAAESRRLGPDALGEPLGIVALDLRAAPGAPLSASHHAKALVIRSRRVSVAFCGGLDLAYTRRHGPPLDGDWQSGAAIPDPKAGWPRGGGIDYSALRAVRPLTARQQSDLPVRVYGDGRTSSARQLWHDQHLRIEGPAVATIEQYLRERWAAPGRPADLTAAPRGSWWPGRVVFSTAEAFDATTGRVRPLPPAAPVAPVEGAATRAQVWRTLPRGARAGGLRSRRGGDYTILAGTARACATATELVWIMDQYFWSRSLARLLNRRLKAVPSLHVLVLLPPYADRQAPFQHRARALALADLVDGLAGDGQPGDGCDRVGVYDLWSPAPVAGGHGRGVYAHAKTQIYDGSLLVCGSANLNRRSLLCDTELACAVLDHDVVADHQRRLWHWLLGGAPWPGVDLDQPGAGRRFMAALRAAVAAGGSLLVPDPWAQPAPALPGGIARPDTPLPGTFAAVYDSLIDPGPVPAAPDGGADLLELAARLSAGAGHGP